MSPSELATPCGPRVNIQGKDDYPVTQIAGKMPQPMPTGGKRLLTEAEGICGGGQEGLPLFGVRP